MLGWRMTGTLIALGVEIVGLLCTLVGYADFWTWLLVLAPIAWVSFIFYLRLT